MSLFETPDVIKSESSDDEGDHSDIDENDNAIGKIEQSTVKEAAPVGRSRNKKVPDIVEESNEKESKTPEKEQKEVAKETVKQISAGKRETTKVMVDRAITALNEKYGSSVVAIRNYILANFLITSESRLRLQVHKYLKKSVEEGKIVQNKLKYKIIPEKKAKAVKPNKGVILKNKKSPKKAATTLKKKEKENAIKVNVTGKTVKKPGPQISANAMKKPPAKKKGKTTEPSSESSAQPKAKKKSEENDKANVKAKPKRALYDNKAVGVGPAKVSKKAIEKAQHDSPIYEEPSSSKRNAQKRNAQTSKIQKE